MAPRPAGYRSLRQILGGDPGASGNRNEKKRYKTILKTTENTENTENTERENDLQCELAAWELLREAESNLAEAIRERDEAREEIRKLQYIKRKHEHEELVAAQENDRLKRERDEAREAFVISTDQMVVAQGKVREANKERDEAREALASERALADRLAENLKIACHAWNNPTEHPAITDWTQARNALAK